MPDINSTFLERLNEAFAYRGVTSTEEKISRLMAATGRTRGTVKRWLSGKTFPTYSLIQIGSDLEIDDFWLTFGKGYTPSQWDLVQALSKIPKHYLPKFTRFCIRLRNEDPKALRWMDMGNRGELTIHQILAMV